MLRAVFFVEPEEIIKSQLNKIISSLSSQYKTALFEAHLTFYTNYYPDEQSILTLFKAISHNTSTFSLKVKQVSATDMFTRSLFLNCEDAVELQALYASAKQLTEAEDSYEYRPHISLMYTAMPADKKEKIMQQLRLPDGEFVFDRIGVAITVDRPANKQDIEQWKLLSMSSL